MEELETKHNLDFSDIIYNLSWEDGEADFSEYEINAGSRICMITTGGDNVLVYLTRDVESIHTFDLNPYQNYLLEMKMAIIKSCNRNEAFRILGQNDYTLFMQYYKTTIRSNLRTNEAREYWDKPNNQNKFKSFFLYGPFAHIARGIQLVGAIHKYKHSKPFINKIMKLIAPLQGVPPRQYEMYGGFDKEAFDLFINWIKYVQKHDCLDSYFYTGYKNGKWDESSLPLYLQPEWYDIVKENLDRVTIITGTILDTIDKNCPVNKFTHINLLDSMDWMTDEEVATQMIALRKYSDEHTRVCFRSANPTQPFGCLLNQFITSKNIYTDKSAHIDRVSMYNSVHVMKFNDKRPIIPKRIVSYKRDIRKDLLTLCQMVLPEKKSDSAGSSLNNSTSLDAFYKSQAEYYDNYRSRMLHGKSKLMGMLPYFDGMKILLFAGGTADISLYIPKIPHTITCMDLCKPLLEVARKRYPHMKTVRADAEKYVSPTKMDFVICSYSLTMIPDWRAAVKCMVKSCKTGGYICCSDFVVCGDNVIRDAIVKAAFAQDHVNLNADHIRYLDNHPKLERVRLCVEDGDFPLMPSIYKSSFYYGMWKKI